MDYDIEQIAKEQGFMADAYQFVLYALNNLSSDSNKRHVSADELLQHIVKLALKEFGALASTAFKFWHVLTSQDIGRIVFSLIDIGVFGKQESDQESDFAHSINLMYELKKPFLPKN